LCCLELAAIHELAKEYREQQNLPNLKLPFNDKRGYYISIPVKDLKGIVLPSFFIQVCAIEQAFSPLSDIDKVICNLYSGSIKLKFLDS
jgi:hypothetical protein